MFLALVSRRAVPSQVKLSLGPSCSESDNGLLGPNKYRKYHIYGVSSEAAGDSAEPEEK
jgi:hypothetical protein